MFHTNLDKNLEIHRLPKYERLLFKLNAKPKYYTIHVYD